jgi:alpha-N-arabinofuranosidase
MKNAQLIVSKDFKIGKINDRLFGSFIEHMGSVIYNGIFEPGHPKADVNGFRTDVLDLAKELQLSVIRYPGGNFTSGYNWEDSIGPQEIRPTKLNLAWRAMEPNTFGLNEFIEWAKQIEAAPIMTINLGTRGIDEARNIVEYCNFRQGSFWSDLRRSYGQTEPYGIKIWCLGNELDGEWQIARKTPDEYGRLACEAAKVMKLIDPQIELVAVGSSARHMPTFPEWDQTVLMHTYDQVDYLSLHAYIDKKGDDTATYLARPIEMEEQIKDVIATCDYVKAKLRSHKTMGLSFDEWNVHRNPDIEYTPWQIGSPFDWCCFTMEDALVFGGMVLSLLRNAGRIQIACQSLLVNTIPLILTEKNGKAWRNATFYPFFHASKFGRGEVLNHVINTPQYDTNQYNDVPAIDSVSVYNEEKGELTVFAINRSDEPIELKIDIRDFKRYKVKEHIVLKNDNLAASNTAQAPFEIYPVTSENTTVIGGYSQSLLDKYSWNVIRYAVFNE